MVLVADVLRQLEVEYAGKPEAYSRLGALADDLRTGRCRVFHPSGWIMSSLNALPGVQATMLFIGEMPGPQFYGGSFYLMDNRQVTVDDCRQVQSCFQAFCSLPGWEPEEVPLATLPAPTAKTVGGLLLCRNGNGWLTLAIFPSNLTAGQSVGHLMLSINGCVQHVGQQLKGDTMSVDHPMVDIAQRGVHHQVTDPRDRVILDTFFEQMRRKQFMLCGAMPSLEGSPGEEETFYSPDNGMTFDFIFAFQSYEEANGWIRYWSAAIDFTPTDRPGDQFIKRSYKYLIRRSSVIPDADLLDLGDLKELPGSELHGAWVVTRTGTEPPTTRLLIDRNLLVPVGLSLLDEAIAFKFFT